MPDRKRSDPPRLELSSLTLGAAEITAMLERAETLRNTDARQYLELGREALDNARELGDEPLIAQAMYTTASAYAACADYGTARELFEESAARFEALDNVEWRGKALNGLGSACWRQGDYAEARRWYEQALEIARRLGDLRRQGILLNNIANVVADQGDYVGAIDHYFQAQGLAQQVNPGKPDFTLLNNLGDIYDKLGDYPKALDYYLKALRAIDNDDRHARSLALLNLGNLYAKTGDRPSARQHLDEALALSRSTGGRQLEAIALLSQGELYNAEGHTASARTAFQSALVIMRDIGDRQGMTQVLRHLGDLREHEGNFQGALHDYDESLTIANALGDPFQIAHALIARGKLLTGERPAEARENLERALEQAEQISSQQLVFEAHRALGSLFEKTGDIPAALSHVRIAWSLERSLYMESAGQRMRQLTASYQQEGMHRAAELEREKNAELQRANDQLTDLNSRLQQRDAENSRLLAENQKLAIEDPLTGLYNRRHFDRRLRVELERAKRFGRPLSLAMADLDHFKKINDRFLHQTGDAVLKIVAQRLQECLREVDYVARYGGEEFVILLPETPAEGAVRVCDKIRKAIEEVNWGELAFGLTVSISMGVSDDLSGGLEGLIHAADRNLYKAKDAGRNRVCA